MQRFFNFLNSLFGSKYAVTPRASLDKDLWRFQLLWLVMALLFIALIGKAFKTQIIDNQRLQAAMDSKIISKDKVVATRGFIADRNGSPLAVSTPLITLRLDVRGYLAEQASHAKARATLANNPTTQQARQAKKVLKQYAVDPQLLALKTGIPLALLQQKIRQNARSRSLLLLRNAPPEKVKAITDLKFAGLVSETHYQRYYPQAEPNAAVIGYINAQSNGVAGIEAKLNKQLAGQDGQLTVIKDGRGNRIKIVSEDTKEIPGQSIELSIDSRMQYILYRTLVDTASQFQASSATALVLDIHTGEVLAMTNWPSFNPNNPAERKPSEASRNRAVQDEFEPGSTMKPLTVAAALQSGLYTVNSNIDTSPGRMKLGNSIISDHQNYGLIPIGDVIVKSSNVGAAKIAQALPDRMLVEFYRSLGLGKSTNVGLPGEARGTIRPYSQIGRIELSTMSYGYGMTTSLIQLASAYATLANDGTYQQPTLLKQQQVKEGKQVLKPEIARAVTEMMEGVVSARGTAIRAAVEGYRVGGKTGTARKLVAGKYSTSEYRSLFVGVAPLSDPRVVVAIVVENPKGAIYGGVVAAPVFAKVTQEVLRLLNTPFDKAFEVPNAQ